MAYCILADKAPYQVLCFLKVMNAKERVNKHFSKAALKEFCKYLYYLTGEIYELSSFDDHEDNETTVKMVANFAKGNPSIHGKHHIPSKEELCGTL